MDASQSNSSSPIALHQISQRRFLCIAIILVLSVLLQIVGWFMVPMFSTHPAVYFITYTCLAIAWMVWLETAWRRIRVTAFQKMFVIVPLCVLSISFILHVYADAPTSSTPQRSKLLADVSLVPFWWGVLVLPVGIAYAIPVRPSFHFLGTREEALRISHESEVDSCPTACAQCGYQPGDSTRITLCPECGCAEFIVRDTNEAMPDIADISREKLVFEPDEVGMSHEEFLARSRCEQCGYKPGSAETITICPECGCESFVVPLEHEEYESRTDPYHDNPVLHAFAMRHRIYTGIAINLVLQLLAVIAIDWRLVAA
ncbi:MAG: hypothetical protein H6815_05170 [Phycisphaeraceae bacterium]|nr:hypothetical protein [Phycisphaerales bacterium]MCB9859827.1 hypothetical protein [Phycisphaeraceae bacterium]